MSKLVPKTSSLPLKIYELTTIKEIKEINKWSKMLWLRINIIRSLKDSIYLKIKSVRVPCLLNEMETN